MPFWKRKENKSLTSAGPKTATYFIVEERRYGNPIWWAYKQWDGKGVDLVFGTCSLISPLDCELKLRTVLQDESFQPILVHVTDITI